MKWSLLARQVSRVATLCAYAYIGSAGSRISSNSSLQVEVEEEYKKFLTINTHKGYFDWWFICPSHFSKAYG